MEEQSEVKGLSGISEDNYPVVPAKYAEAPAIDRLQDPETHRRVLNYLVGRISYSEKEMQKLKPRWRVNEKKYQAYVSLPNWEQVLQDMTDKGAPPKTVSVVIPYTYATISTIVTYLIHTFAGRRPMFQVGATKKETAESSRNMELVLQYNADHTRLIKHLFQFLLDGQQYGVSILRCQWQREVKVRTKWETRSILGLPVGGKQKVREPSVVYEGNEICSIDPYNFYPDPRVPMAEVNRKGEFVFWKDSVGYHKLKLYERQGKVKYVDRIGDTTRDPFGSDGLDSDRSLRAGGNSSPGRLDTEDSIGRVTSYVEVFQGTCEIIPAELGLGEEEYPVKYLFSIGNRNQIIQAQPLELDHDMHPVVVSEPYTMGYSFGHLGISDYLGPVQDTMSWLINSHMDNVRTALNNMFVVDPSRIEMQDMLKPGAGKLIRMKKAAYGSDAKQALHQFQVQDVTHGHTNDLQLFMRIGDAMSSVTDNLRGQQDHGGRKTATEVRTSGEAAASRLAALAKFISAQALTDLTEQMSMNNQQNLSDDFYVEIVGQDGLRNHIRIEPQMLTGDFHYPIHDGTLPLDRVAMVDVWKEIFMGVAQNESLSSRFDVVEIFKHVAELGGAKNIERFEIQAAPDDQILEQADRGQASPMGEQTPGVEANPGGRLAGGLM